MSLRTTLNVHTRFHFSSCDLLFCIDDYTYVYCNCWLVRSYMTHGTISNTHDVVLVNPVVVVMNQLSKPRHPSTSTIEMVLIIRNLDAPIERKTRVKTVNGMKASTGSSVPFFLSNLSPW